MTRIVRTLELSELAEHLRAEAVREGLQPDRTTVEVTLSDDAPMPRAHISRSEWLERLCDRGALSGAQESMDDALARVNALRDEWDR